MSKKKKKQSIEMENTQRGKTLLDKSEDNVVSNKKGTRVQMDDKSSEQLSAAKDLDEVSRVLLAGGARDVAQGEEAKDVAQYASLLSQVVSNSGINDISQGATLLAASEDIAVQSALIAALSEDELGYGMDLAAIAGQLWTASDVVASLNMPVLADFLEIKGEELQNIAVEILLRFGATSAMADYLKETGRTVGGLGVNEMEEGAARIDFSADMEARSEELAQTGAELTAQGLSQLAAAEGMRDAARDLVTGSVTSNSAVAKEETEETLDSNDEE